MWRYLVKTVSHLLTRRAFTYFTICEAFRGVFTPVARIDKRNSLAKNQVKSICSSWDLNLLERVFYRPARNVYFTDQNQKLLKEIVMAYQNRHLVKIWSKLVKSICQNSISGQFKILVCKIHTNRWPKNFPEFWITVS